MRVCMVDVHLLVCVWISIVEDKDYKGEGGSDVLYVFSTADSYAERHIA